MATPRDADALQNGAYVALSRKFLWTTENDRNFSLVLQTRNTMGLPALGIFACAVLRSTKHLLRPGGARENGDERPAKSSAGNILGNIFLHCYRPRARPYQFANNWVIGVEGDIGASNLNGARTCSSEVNVFVVLTCRDASNWMATLAGRVGYSWNRTLFYMKAGGAWADDRTSTSCAFGPLNGTQIGVFTIGPCINSVGAPTNGFSSTGTRSGWLIGYGTEFDLGNNWSAKAEYGYTDLGSRTATMSDGVTVMKDSGAISQVKIGVNYRFTPGAVVAKY